jgi:hypothetical protein
LKSSSRYGLSFSLFSTSETRTVSAMTNYLLRINCRTLSQRGDFIATAAPRQEEFHTGSRSGHDCIDPAFFIVLEKVRRFR